MFKKSFAPIIPATSKLLILGSLPGDRSLQQNEYYAHPQNRFWRTLTLLFDKPFPIHYAEKMHLLHQHHSALWDVCKAAIRKGSMDMDIREEQPNNIDRLLHEHPEIRVVCFNGQNAQKLFDKYFNRLPHLQYITLPSTSPANASFNQERLLAAWQIVQTMVSNSCSATFYLSVIGISLGLLFLHIRCQT